MPVIEIETRIDASIETVFDLARSIDLHVQSTAQTNEQAVAGCTTGLISLGESVTWEATHFGVKQRLATKIVQHFALRNHWTNCGLYVPEALYDEVACNTQLPYQVRG